MRILHIVQGLELTSGVSAFLVEVANRQIQNGHDVAILYERFFEYRPAGSVKVFKARSPAGIDFHPDVVHVHAVWSVFNVKAMMWCRRNRIPYIVSPHGCLMPRVFAKGKVKKSIFYHILLKPLLQKASALHATASSEAKVLKELDLKPRIFVVPLGVDLPVAKPHVSHPVKTVLFVGRLSEEKGLVNLLHAWSRLNHAGWRLIIAGPDWMGYKHTIDKEVARLSLDESIEFPGAIFGDVKERFYRLADLFVLPSPMENFSAVVLEAMSYSLPVIATKGTPWQMLEERGCGWWIDQGLQSLIDALGCAMKISGEKRAEMGSKGRALVEEAYTWDCVADKLMSEVNING